MRVAKEILLSEKEFNELTRYVGSKITPVRLIERAQIILFAAEGLTNKDISQRLGITETKVGRWRNRFLENRIPSLLVDKPRGLNHGGKSTKAQAKLREKIIQKTTQEKPEGATHWSTRSMAAALNTTHSFVNRVWQSVGLKPHLEKTFKVSNDKYFEEKLCDVVGLYLNPPENAVIFCVDEKTSIQALDRSQPGLSMKKGRCETMTHDYKRNGTTTLFAALEVASGSVIGECYPKHTHKEFLKFIKQVEKETEQDKTLHIIVDNYATHKHPKVKSWLSRNKRVFLHFIPTSSSWLNLVERFFGVLTTKQLKRGVFSSVKDLEQKITEFIACHNKDPKPFIWTKSTEEILKKVNRARAALNNVKAV